VLAVAVVGGLFRLEGAWVGAFAFALVDYIIKRWLGGLHVFGDSFNGVTRFETWFGIVFLAIVLISPGGLMGLWSSLENVVRRALRRRAPAGPHEPAAEQP